MAYAERSAVGNANRQVGEDGKDSVCQGGSEGQVVRNLVDGEEEVLVCGRTNDIGGR